MPASKYNDQRSDGQHVGAKIKEIVRLMLEDGMSWQTAASTVGVPRSTAYKALHKPHVVTYRREQRAKMIELLSGRVPRTLDEIMTTSDNANARVRAALALHQMDVDLNVNNEPTRRLALGGIVIQLSGGSQRGITEQAAVRMLDLRAEAAKVEAGGEDDGEAVEVDKKA
jgi:hypothetical protein